MKKEDEKFVEFLKRLFIAFLNFNFFALGYSITGQIRKSVFLICALLVSITLLFLFAHSVFWLIFLPMLMILSIWIYNVLNPLFIPNMKFENVILRGIMHFLALIGVVIYTVAGASIFISKTPLHENLKRLQNENLMQYIPNVYVVPKAGNNVQQLTVPQAIEEVVIETNVKQPAQPAEPVEIDNNNNNM